MIAALTGFDRIFPGPYAPLSKHLCALRIVAVTIPTCIARILMESTPFHNRIGEQIVQIRNYGIHAQVIQPMLIDCTLHIIKVVDAHHNASHLAPVDTGELAQTKGVGFPVIANQVKVTSGMLRISVFIQVVNTNAHPVISIAQLAVQPQVGICAHIHWCGEGHTDNGPIALGLCPEVQRICAAVGFIGNHLITGHPRLDTGHRERAGMKQIIRVEGPFQLAVGIMGHRIDVYCISGRYPNTHTKQLARIKLTGL